jgi:hypothetical protein
MNPTRPRVAPALLAIAAACLGPAASAGAQGFGPDPFRPYNSQYDPYVFCVAPGPHEPVLDSTINRQGVRNANQFREALELDNANRYDRAFRAHDRERGRLYRPNAAADKNLGVRRGKASELYFRYFSEKDPRKRAALFREYNQAQAEVARGVTDDPNARGSRRARGAGGIPPAPAGRGSGEPRQDAGIPAVPDDLGDRPAPAARGRRAPSASDVPPAPSGDDPSPTEVLDRASRSRRAAPTPPQVP